MLNFPVGWKPFPKWVHFEFVTVFFKYFCVSLKAKVCRFNVFFQQFQILIFWCFEAIIKKIEWCLKMFQGVHLLYEVSSNDEDIKLSVVSFDNNSLVT